MKKCRLKGMLIAFLLINLSFSLLHLFCFSEGYTEELSETEKSKVKFVCLFLVDGVKKLVKEKTTILKENEDLKKEDNDTLKLILDHIDSVKQIVENSDRCKIDILLLHKKINTWAKGMMKYGVIEIAPLSWEPLSSWPDRVIRRNDEQLVTSKGEKVIPGLSYIKFKLIPLTISMILVGLSTGQDTKVFIKELREVSGQDFGYDINLWLRWYRENEKSFFRIYEK